MDLVLVLLVILVVFVVLPLLAVLVGGLLVRRNLHRRNRVSPDVRSPAPASWVSRPDAAARLHRRLRAAVTVARHAATRGGPSSPLPELAADLEREAVALDADVVMVARLPRAARRPHLQALADRVQTVERAASQMSVLAVQSRADLTTVGGQDAIGALAERLDALEAARHEVARAEEAGGVRRASPYAAGG